MTFHIRLKRFLPLLVLLAMSSNCWSAGNLPGYYPESFQATGFLGNAAEGKSHIYIDGVNYKLSFLVRVHTPTKPRASLLDLKAGQAVGYSFKTDSSGKRTLQEIWVLPENTIQAR